MCTIKAEADEDKATIGRVGSECGGIDEARLGANTEQEDSEPPTPKKSIRALPKLIKEEVEDEVKVKVIVEDEDDPLLYLTHLFSFASLDEDSDDEDDSDESVPSSPRPPRGFSGSERCKCLNNKHCFYASGCLYYFDNFRNVYAEDGRPVSDGSLNLQADDLLTPSFHIDGVPYWFGIEGLLYQTADGTLERVHVWESDSTPFDLGQVFDPIIDSTTFRPEASPELYYNSSPSPASTWASNGEHGTPKAKGEIPSPPVNHQLHTLQETMQLPWLPTSSTRSPTYSTGYRETSPESLFGPSLFPDSLSTLTPANQISKWREDTAHIQQDRLKTQTSGKPKYDRRRCPTATRCSGGQAAWRTISTYTRVKNRTNAHSKVVTPALRPSQT